MNSFDEDQDVEGALKYLKIKDLQEKFRDLAITLMPHVSLPYLSYGDTALIDRSKSSVSSS